MAESADDSFFWEWMGCPPPEAVPVKIEQQRQTTTNSAAPPKPAESPETKNAEPTKLLGVQDKATSQQHTSGDPIDNFSLEMAISMQDMLIEEYKKEEFQDKLHEAWAAAGADELKQLKARQEVCLPIQGPIIQKFGFEPTRKGVSQSVTAFKPFNYHPDVTDRNMTMQYLVNPPQQNTKWINGFEEAPRWWQRAQRRQEATRDGVKRNPFDCVEYTFEEFCKTYVPDYSIQELANFWDTSMEFIEQSTTKPAQEKAKMLQTSTESSSEIDDFYATFLEAGPQPDNEADEKHASSQQTIVAVEESAAKGTGPNIPVAADQVIGPSKQSLAPQEDTSTGLRKSAPQTAEKNASNNVRGPPVSLKPGHAAEEPKAVQEPHVQRSYEDAPDISGEQRPAVSVDDAIAQLSRLQIVLAVPTVAQLRAGRPLRRHDDEIYASQFVLQSTSRNFSKYLSSEEGKAEFHPYLKTASSVAEEEEGSFGKLDDGTHVVYQTNGIARTEEPLLNMPIKCERTNAPGHYMETKMLVARRRKRGAAGQYGTGIKAARSFQTREDVESNLFYSFTSCWQIYACVAPVGELGEDDSGERILIRRSVKDFTQHHFHDFPVAKHLTELIDGENHVLVNAFSFNPRENLDSTSMFAYQCYSLRSWQTYEFDNKPPEEDMGFRLVNAARIGHVAELQKLVLECGCDCDTIISEFGVIGAGRSGVFTRTSMGFAEERNALVAAVEAGWVSVVEAIIELADAGKANLNIVCHEWNPCGIGGDCLRGNYTALDQACLYHRSEIKEVLLRARAKYSRHCPKSQRENPFHVRAKQDKGEYANTGWEQKSHEHRYADFTFTDWGEEVQMDDEMRQIVAGLKKELREMRSAGEAENSKAFKKLCLRWHPDKHPDERKGLATRIFQWLQRARMEQAENKHWTA